MEYTDIQKMALRTANAFYIHHTRSHFHPHRQYHADSRYTGVQQKGTYNEKNCYSHVKFVESTKLPRSPVFQLLNNELWIRVELSSNFEFFLSGGKNEYWTDTIAVNSTSMSTQIDFDSAEMGLEMQTIRVKI